MFFIELFDNEEYDCRTPEDWLALGNADGSPDRKPIPGKALLPTDDEIANGKVSQICTWMYMYVHVYIAVLGAALGVGAWPPNVCRSM